MSKVITASIDVTKIDKSKLITGEKGTYLNIAIIETPNSEYNTHMVVQSISKEEREAGQEGAILGGVKRWGDKPSAQDAPAPAQQQEQAPAQQQSEEDDLPF